MSLGKEQSILELGELVILLQTIGWHILGIVLAELPLLPFIAFITILNQ